MKKIHYPLWRTRLNELARAKPEDVTLWDQRFIDDCLLKRRKRQWTPNHKQKERLNEIWYRVFYHEKSNVKNPPDK